MAARQRRNCTGLVPLWPEIRCPAHLQRSVRGGELHGLAAAARAVLRLRLAATDRTDALSRRLYAAGLGECDRVRVGPGQSRTELRTARRRNPARSPGAPGLSRQAAS